jgi:hypothetical protein
MLHQVSLFFFALFAIAFSGQTQEFSGTILQNGWAHRINTSEPQDSNQIIMSIDGNQNRGTITITAHGPTTFCPWGPSSCGRGVSDSTVVIAATNKKLSLVSLTNNPATVLGQVSNYHVVGTWNTDGSFHMTISYIINMVIPNPNIPGGITSQVPIKGVYSGSVQTIQVEQVFTGYLMAFVVPYVSVQHGGTDPYEFLVVYGAIDSSQDFSAMAGYRVYSPLGTDASPVFPGSPNAVAGTVSNVTFDGGLISGKITMSTPVGTHVNVVDADFFSDYEWIDSDTGYLRITAGKVTDQTGVEFWLDNLNVILEDY